MSAQRNLVTMNANLLVTTQVSATRPSISTDGVDITNWRTTSPYAPPLAALMLVGTAAANVSSPTGGSNGAEVWGYVTAQSEWFLIGYLNSQTAVPIVGSAQGYAQEIDVIGIFDRLAVAGTVSAGTVTAKLAPIDTYT